MRSLFAAAKRYVIVYSSNFHSSWPGPHVRHREFTRWVEVKQSEFTQVKTIENWYPYCRRTQTIRRRELSYLRQVRCGFVTTAWTSVVWRGGAGVAMRQNARHGVRSLVGRAVRHRCTVIAIECETSVKEVDQ